MRNYVLAILSGVLVTLSFPTVLWGWHVPDMGIIGWVALVPLFIAIARTSPARTFLISFVAGLVWFGGSIYWIYMAVHEYGGLGMGISLAITVLMIVILASYVSVAPLVARWVTLRWKGEMLVFLPVAWVAVAYLRGHVPMGGFPWANIAMSQWQLLVPLQMIDITGVYGLIFLMVWVNWCIAELIGRIAVPSGRGLMRWAGPKVVVTLVLLAAVMGYGLVRLNSASLMTDERSMVSVGLVQANISQEMKWNPEHTRTIMRRYQGWTKKIFASGVDLILWPEASFPRALGDQIGSADPRVFGLPQNIQGDLPAVMIGAIVYGEGSTAYNSALLFNAEGHLTGRYDKNHLVPFGEYVPYQDYLFFAKKLTAPVGDFVAGTSATPLSFPLGVIGPLICYEDVFPDISRALVKGGATFLVNLTNDAWYGVSSAPYQHLALSVFRAVENRRHMVRATNTGVSAIIAPTGDVHMDSPLFEQLALVGAIESRTEQSLYTRSGDWFAYACMAYAALGAVLALVQSIRRRRTRS